MTLTDTTHHVGSRRPCADCGTQAFEYADEVVDGQVVRHFCRMCANRRRGATLCRFCFRPIAYSAMTGAWFHTDVAVFAIKHPAQPEDS